MRRLWVRWLGLLLFVIVCSVAFISLGRWQLDRLEQRHHTNALVNENAAAPAVDPIPLMADGVATQEEFRHVTVTGEYDAAHQLVVRYRNLGGAQGFEVVTPLRTSTGTVLVNRGFVKQGPALQPNPGPPPPGQVTVTGFVQRNHVGDAKAMIPVNGNIRLVSSGPISTTLGIPLVDGYIALESSTPAQASELTPLGLPAPTEGPHFSYAMQWFAFTLIAVTGLFVFIRADLRERRKAREAAKPPAAAEEGSKA